MIFSDNFDRALWLVLSSNKRDRRLIGDVIGMFPDYVYKEIQEFISKRNGDEFRKSYRDLNGYESYVIVKVIADELLFNVDRWKEENGIRCEESFQFNLVAVSRDDMNAMILQNNRIGSLSYEINDNISFSDMDTIVKNGYYNRDYNMYMIPFGCIMSTSLGYRLFSLMGVNYNKRMPNELYSYDFNDRDSINRLVKSRKR